MAIDRIDELSGRQIECLRLLLLAGSSKGVAEKLGISPGTVDQHLKAARRILGVHDSWTAAQLLAGHQPGDTQTLDTQPETVADPNQNLPTITTPDENSTAEQDDGEVFVQAERGDPAPPPTAQTIWDLLFPPTGRPPNALDFRARLTLIIFQVGIVMASVAVLFGLVLLMSRVLIELNRYGG